MSYTLSEIQQKLNKLDDQINKVYEEVRYQFNPLGYDPAELSSLFKQAENMQDSATCLMELIEQM